MSTQPSSVMDCLSALMARANASSLTPLRLKDWQKVIQWVVGEETRYWSSSDRQFQFSEPAVPNFVLKCSPETLARIAEGKLPFFIALWGTGDIQFEGSFADAYRLGYVFCSDKRQRRVIFISHCWLNINTRFPEGAAFEGANVPLIKTLLDSGLGLIQMPCPEYECLGLEKWNYGTVVGEELRAGFRASAERVIRQIKDYRALGYEIVGVLGMNPSPSCGVGVSKGKGTMLGTSRDTSEKAESGIFIEELTALMEQEAIRDIPVFAVRRLLVGEIGIEERIEFLKSQIGV